MPYKRRYKRRRKRRTRRRKKRSKNRMTVWKLSSNLIVPDKIMVKLPYTDLFKISTTTPAEFTYRGNSCFDPDQTGVGTQPLGFDQYAVFYDEYRVYSSSIMMQCTNQSVSGVHMSVIPSKGNVGAGSFIVSVQQPYARYRFAAGIAGQDRFTIKSYMSTKKFWGRKVSTEDNFAADTTSNPTNQWFWVTEIQSSDKITDLNIDILIKLVYWVEFSARKILAAS